MKFPLFPLALALLACLEAPAQAPKIRAMSFNIRLPHPDDGYDYWDNRREMVASMIRYHDADLVGLQEAFRFQIDELLELLPGYGWYGLCRTDGSTDPDPDNEFSAILFREGRFRLLDSGTFWLSEKPEVAGGKGWDAALPRIVSWVHLEDRSSGQLFYHFNTHFDHRGQVARAESARLAIAKTKEIAGAAPYLLTGDFNCTPTDVPYRLLVDEESGLADALLLSEAPHHGPLSTWSGFRFPGLPGRRIDYIFVSPGVRVLRHAILSDSWSGRFPSDHLPVLAELAFEGQ